MKRFTAVILVSYLTIISLLAQKKEENSIKTYVAFMSSYSIVPTGNAIALNSEYQYRYKNIGIGGNFSLEYAASKNGGHGKRYDVGTVVFGWKPSGHNAYQSNEQWLNVAPSLLGYYYLGEKRKWEGFFKTGIVANCNIWYAYNGLEYKTDYMGKIIAEGFIQNSQTSNSIDLQSINWLIGGGVQYKLTRLATFRIASEIQWGRGISILGGFVFKV